MADSMLPNIHMPSATGNQLLAQALHHLVRLNEPKVQVLVDRGDGAKTVNKLRVALSRSRNRNSSKNRKILRFTLNHSIYPYTAADGTRFDAVVLSIQKNRLHRALELVDDIMERSPSNGGVGNVA